MNTDKQDVTALPLCPTHGPVDAVFWHGALVCPDTDCHRTCSYPDGDTRNGAARFDLWPETGHFETEPKR